MSESDVQSFWEVPCIAHFCSLYRKTFDLLDFDIEELEEALLIDSNDEELNNSLIQDLIVRLLKGCFGSQQKDDITSFNYQMYLRRLFRIKCEEEPNRQNPFNNDIAFHSLPLKNRVEILHDLCNFRLDADVIPESLRVLESDSLRVRPLGCDSGGSTYWYFYGTRLYREDYNTKPKNVPLKKHIRKSRKSETSDNKWVIACTTEEDWQLLTNKFKNCKSKDEKALYERLRDQFLPELPRLFAEREKLISKRMMDPHPRRSNRAVPSGLLTIPPTPSHSTPKTSSDLFDQLQSLKESEEKEKEEARRKAGMEAGNNSNNNNDAKASAEKSSDEDEPLNPDSQLTDEERAQRQREEQEKADRLFAEQLEREERMSRLQLRERRFSGAGGRSRASDAQVQAAITSSRECKPKSQTSSKRRGESSSPSRSRSRSEKRKGSSGKGKGEKKVKSSRMTNNSLSASLLGDSENGSGDDDDGNRSSGDDDQQKYSSSDSDSDRDTKRKKSKKGDVSPTKKDIRKKVFSGSSRAKQKKSGSMSPDKKKKASGESSSKSGSKKSDANSGGGVGLGTSKTKMKSSILFSQNEEDVLIGMHKVIETVKSHRDAWPFVNPVDEEYAPGYFKVVKEPMDIQTMEDKLDNQEYHSVDQFKEDFQKIVDNCRMYNGASSEYTEMVETIEEVFNKTIQRVMIQDESDDEEISIEYANAGSGQKKKKRSSSTSNEKSKSESKKKRSSSTTVEDDEGVTKPKSKSEKSKKESSSSSKNKEKPSTSGSSKSSLKSKKEQLMRHHSHKSDKDGRKVVSATAEALKDMNKWLDETVVGGLPAKPKKEKRKRDDGDSADDASPSRSRTNSTSKSFRHEHPTNAGLTPSQLEFASAFEITSPSRKKKYLKSIDKESKLSSSRDGDDKSKPVKKRHRHHSSEQKKHSAVEGDSSDKDDKHNHHHHHHHHRHHSHSSADGEARGSLSGKSSQVPPKKRGSTSISTTKRKKPYSSASSSPAPVRKSTKKEGDHTENSKPSSSMTVPTAAKRKEGAAKSAPKKPLMKRSISLLQGFKNNANSMKRLQVGKATKFNIKHSVSLTLDSESNSRENNNGAGKSDVLPPWKRSSGTKALTSSSEASGSVVNRSATSAATAEFLKWQQSERGLESRLAWLKGKKDGPKLSLGTVLPKHAINVSGLNFSESGANGLSDTEQNGSGQEDEEVDDDEDEDLLVKLERGLANLSRGTLSDKARDLLASNPGLAAKIALNGVEKVREEAKEDGSGEKKAEDGSSPTSTAKPAAPVEDRKLEPMKGFNAEKSLPNLSAWFKAFGAPSSNSSSGTSTAATTPTTVTNSKEDSNSPTSAAPPTHTITKPKFRVMGRTPGGEKATAGSGKSVDSSNVKGEQQLSVRGSGSSHSPPLVGNSGKAEAKEPEKTRRAPQHRNRKASTSSMSSQSEVGSPAVYYGNSGNIQDSGVINPPRWADSNMEHPTWGSQSPSASSQVSSQSPAGPNSPFSPAAISSPPETPPRPIGPVRVGFYQDITNSSSQHSSPEKAGSNESPQNIINVTSPATPPTTTSQPTPSKRETSVLKGYPTYASNYAQRYGVNNSNSPSPSGPATPGNNTSVTSPPSVEARPAPDSPPVSNNKTYTHLESKKPQTSEALPPRVMYDPPRWSPYPPGHPLYHPPSLPRAHLASAPASSPHADMFSPNPSNYNQPETYGQPEAAHSRNNSRYNPNNMSGGPQAAHSNSQPQAAHQYTSSSSSSSTSSPSNMSQLLRGGTPLIQSQLPTYTSNPYASNPRNVNIPPNIYNNPIADRIGTGLGMIPMSSSSALTLTNTSSTSSSSSSSGRGKKGHQHQQQQSSNETQSGSTKGSSDVGNMNGFQWPHPHHPMAGLTQIVNNLPGSMNPYISRGGHHPHYDPEAMAKYARGGVVDPIGYTNLSAGASKSASHPHPEMLAKGLVNLSTSGSSGVQTSSATAAQTSGGKTTTTTSGGRRGRGEGKKTKAAAAAAAAAQQQQSQQQQQQPMVPGSAFNFSSLGSDLCLYPKEIASSVRSGSSGGTSTPGPSPSPYSIPPYIGSHPSPYHQSQPSQSSPFGSSPRGIVDPYQQFFPGSPHVLPLLTPTSSYAQAYAAAAAHNPSAHAAAHGLGFTRPGWI